VKLYSETDPVLFRHDVVAVVDPEAASVAERDRSVEGVVGQTEHDGRGHDESDGEPSA